METAATKIKGAIDRRGARRSFMSEERSTKTVAELAALAGGRVVSGGDVVVERVAGVESAGAGALAFVEEVKRLEEASGCGASCLIVPEGAGERAREIAPGVAAVVEAPQPKLAFALAAAALRPMTMRASGVHPTAVVAGSA